jgi:hypothetical protein
MINHVASTTKDFQNGLHRYAVSGMLSALKLIFLSYRSILATCLSTVSR